MAPQELREVLRHQPFEPFRLVMTDGVGYEIRHPDLVWVGMTSAHVGLTGDPGQTFYERSVKIDLRHVIRLDPLESSPAKKSNGAA